MEVDINQRKVSIGAKYRIYLNGNEKYFAKRELFRFFGEINLFDRSGVELRYQMKQNWSWFKLSYDIIKYDNRIYELRVFSCFISA